MIYNRRPACRKSQLSELFTKDELRCAIEFMKTNNAYCIDDLQFGP